MEMDKIQGKMKFIFSFLIYFTFFLSIFAQEEKFITIETNPEECQVKVFQWVPFKEHKGTLLIEGKSPLKIPVEKLKDIKRIVIRVEKEGYLAQEWSFPSPFEMSLKLQLKSAMNEISEESQEQAKIEQEKQPKGKIYKPVEELLKEKIYKLVEELFISPEEHPLARQALVSQRALEAYTAAIVTGYRPIDEGKKAVDMLCEMGPAIWPLTMDLFLKKSYDLYNSSLGEENVENPISEDVIQSAVRDYIQFLINNGIIRNAQFLGKGAPMGVPGGIGVMGIGPPGYRYKCQYFSQGGFFMEKEIIFVYIGVTEDGKNFILSYYIPDLVDSSLGLQKQIIKNKFRGIPVPEDLVSTVERYVEKKENKENLYSTLKTGIENIWKLASKLVEKYQGYMYHEIILNNAFRPEIRIIPLVEFLQVNSSKLKEKSYPIAPAFPSSYYFNYNPSTLLETSKLLKELYDSLSLDSKKIFDYANLSDRINAVEQEIREKLKEKP